MKKVDKKPKKEIRPVFKAKKEIPVSKNSLAIESFFSKYGFYVFLFLIFSVILFVFYDYIILKKIYLFKDIGSDSINIFYPYWIYISDYLRTDGLPQWSHQVGMGQSIFMFDIGNMFSLILFAIGRDGIPYAIAYMEMLKILLSGLLIYFYIRSFNTSKYVATVGALIYSFCGYIILGGCGWYTQSTEVFFAALFLFSVEKFLKNQWYWLPVAACVIGLNSAYFLFPYGVLLIIYLTVRYIDEKGFDLKKITGILLYAGACFLLGALMSSFSVIGTLQIIYNSPRVSGDASGFSKLSSTPIFSTATPVEYISFLMRLFSNDLTGNGNDYKGWGNYLEGPVLYIGLPTLLIFSQFFTGLTKQRKILYAACSLFVLMIIVFPFFRYMFWGFALDYFRTFSFFISLFIFYLAFRSLNNIMDKNVKVNLLSLGISLTGCLVILYFNNPIKDQIQIASLRDIITLFLIAYSILLALFRFSAFRPTLKIVFLVLLCIELIYFSNTTINKRDTMSGAELNEKVGYNDYTVDAVKYLNENEKDPFYRITKYYSSGTAMHGSMNDGLVQGYKSTISYSSFNQKYYIKFLQGINVVQKGSSTDAKWAQGVRARPLLQSLVSSKYVLQKSQNGNLDTLGYRKVKTFGDVDLYLNRTYVPLGITFSKYILTSDFSKMSNLNKDVSLLKALVIEDSLVLKYHDFEKFNLNDSINTLSYAALYAATDSLKSEHLIISKVNNNHLEGKINLNSGKIMMLSIPFDEGWKLKVNGKPHEIEIVNYGLMGISLNKGDNIISLDYFPPYKNLEFALTGIFVLVFILLFIFFRKKTLIKIQ